MSFANSHYLKLCTNYYGNGRGNVAMHYDT